MKYFVISDIHSFATEMKKALRQAGFNKRNKDHTLVVLGDVFDRGPETLEVYKYLKSIPKKRCILVRGNHEQLLFDCLEKTLPERHDYSNGTVKSICHIAQLPNVDEYAFRFKYAMLTDDYSPEDRMKYVYNLWSMTVEEVKNSEVYKWLKSKQWVNYWEMDNYIGVHAFIPSNYIDGVHNEATVRYFSISNQLSPKVNWRESTDLEWQQAAWGCPFKDFDNKLFDMEKEKGKTLICGHFHASAFHEHYNTGKDTDEIYFGDHLIAIDACTAASGFCNVLVIDKDNK